MSDYKCMDDHIIAKERPYVDEILSEPALANKVAIFKMLGDSNRMKIVELLSHYPQLCVYEISQFINASVATTSHHLIALRKHSIIRSVKDGKRVIYMLDSKYVTELIKTAEQLKTQCERIKQT